MSAIVTGGRIRYRRQFQPEPYGGKEAEVELNLMLEGVEDDEAAVAEKLELAHRQVTRAIARQIKADIEAEVNKPAKGAAPKKASTKAKAPKPADANDDLDGGEPATEAASAEIDDATLQAAAKKQAEKVGPKAIKAFLAEEFGVGGRLGTLPQERRREFLDKVKKVKAPAADDEEL